MIPKFFGQYLLEKRIITREQLADAINYQHKQRQKLGELAVSGGYMSKPQVEEVHREQKSSDALFGEIAVRKGYLNPKDLKKLITLQDNSHIYFGDALVKLGILSESEIECQLVKFKNDQKDIKHADFGIPVKHSMAEYFPYFIDMLLKLLLRIAGIEAKTASPFLKSRGSETFYTTTIVEFSEDIKLRLVINLNEKITRVLADEFIGEEVRDEEIVIENAGEFANIVCGNISTKLQIMGIRTQISVPTVLTKLKENYFEYRNAEKAIAIPLITTEGPCEVQILVSGLEAYVSNKKRVLIVDDSKSVALKLTRIIESLTDFEVVGHAKTAFEAVALYKEHMPDLVTMDIVLPDKSGLSAIKDLIQIDPEANIIVISSVGGSQDKLFQAIQCGAKNVIVKPFDDDTVREIFIQSV